MSSSSSNSYNEPCAWLIYLLFKRLRDKYFKRFYLGGTNNRFIILIV